ncbi:MAG: DedA family protein [Actinomycetota bacterium]
MARAEAVSERHRTTLLWLSAARVGISVVALPLAPFLYKHHYLILVVMRPTRLVLFVGGYFAKQHKANPFELAAAALPMAWLGVWLAYALGLSHERRIASGRIPKPWKRLLPARRIRRLQETLRDQGIKLVLLARMATFPNYLIGTAAGSSDMSPHKFFVSDGIGTAIEIGASLALGYVLGDRKAWIVGIGIGALLAGVAIFFWQFRRE